MIERYIWDIYTDSSCNSKNRLGGCGVYMVNKTTGEEIFFREGYCNTTTPRMEMRAIINALELLPKGNPIKARIVCDSEFVVKFMNHHISRCLGNGNNITNDSRADTSRTFLCSVQRMYKNTLKARYANQTWQLTIVWFCP
jgi:ribonuclease HI